MLAGLIRTLGTIIMVWFVFRWLDRMFGGKSRRSAQRKTSKSSDANADHSSGASPQPKDTKLGDYIDFEEVEE